MDRGRMALLADDLTGAADASVQFGRWAGWRVRVVWRKAALRPGGGGAAELDEVDGPLLLAVSSESRDLPAEAAQGAVRRCLERLGALGARIVYRKVDSTLRGPVAAELEAAIRMLGVHVALLCPAFPAQGRTVVDGRLMVNGRVHPLGMGSGGTGHIPQWLAGMCRCPVRAVALEVVRQGAGALARALDEHAGRAEPAGEGCVVVVVDAATEDDLRAVAEAAVQRADVLPVGSAGLAGAMAAALASPHGGVPGGRPRAGTEPLRPSSLRTQAQPGRAGQAGQGGAVLVVCGSVHPAAQAQLAALRRRAGWRVVDIDLRAALADEASWRAARRGAVRRVVGALQSGLSTALAYGGADDGVRVALSADVRRGWAPGLVGRRLAEALADVVDEAVVGMGAESGPVVGLVLTGGDTASAVLDKLGATALDLVGEVQPGVVAGRVWGGRAHGWPVVTKAGGFGNPEVLAEAAAYLAEGGNAGRRGSTADDG